MFAICNTFKITTDWFECLVLEMYSILQDVYDTNDANRHTELMPTDRHKTKIGSPLHWGKTEDVVKCD